MGMKISQKLHKKSATNGGKTNTRDSQQTLQQTIDRLLLRETDSNRRARTERNAVLRASIVNRRDFFCFSTRKQIARRTRVAHQQVAAAASTKAHRGRARQQRKTDKKQSINRPTDTATRVHGDTTRPRWPLPNGRCVPMGSAESRVGCFCFASRDGQTSLIFYARHTPLMEVGI